MKLATIIGARPQFIKSAVLSRKIKDIENIKEVLIHTGQHYDKNMSEVFFKELEIPEPEYNLEVGSGSHGAQTALMLQRIEEVLIKEKPDWVVIYGDTNSTVAGALAASKMHIKTAHIEAGLRSFDRRMPEEINRIVADHTSDILMAPTKTAMNLLEKEGLAEKSHFTGDLMYDSILYYKDKQTENKIANDIIGDKPYYLATVHRPANTDNPETMQRLFGLFSELSYPVILPLHPRLNERIKSIKYSDNLKIISPVSYLDMVCLLRDAAKVFTDSGGLQKEAYFMQTPCLTLRDTSEWRETLEGAWNFLVGSDIELIREKLACNEYGKRNNSFGDGHASEEIIKLLLEYKDIPFK